MEQNESEALKSALTWVETAIEELSEFDAFESLLDSLQNIQERLINLIQLKN